MDGFEVEIREPGAAPRPVRLTGSVDVGRECEGLMIADPVVSRRHMRFAVSGRRLSVTDLGSSNGTLVNGVSIGSQPNVPVDVGDVVQIGTTDIVVTHAPTVEPRPQVPITGSAMGSAALVEPPIVVAPLTSLPPDAAASAPVADPAPVGQSQLAHRPVSPARARDGALSSIEVDGFVVHFRPGSAGAVAAPAYAAALKRARKRLVGFGSEPWGAPVQVFLVDPIADPDAPGEVMTGGTIVDAEHDEIWMVVTAESPAEPPERPLALLFGAALPAAADLGPLLEGFGLDVAMTPDPDARLKGIDLPPLGAPGVDGDMAAAMSLSFVRYLGRRGRSDDLRKLLAQSKPGRVDATAEEIFGAGLTTLEERWRQALAEEQPPVKTGEFLRLALRYVRPHRRRELEMFVYSLLGLTFTIVFPFVLKRLLDTAIPSGQFSKVAELLGVLGAVFAISLLADLRRSFLAAYVSGAVVREIRVEMFDRLQSLSSSWFSGHEQGDVLSRVFNDVGLLEAGLSQTLRDGTVQALSLVVAAIVLLVLNPVLGVLVLLGAPAVGVVYKVMSKGAQTRSLEVQEQLSGVLAVSAENYGAQPVVKAFALEAREKLRFGRASDRLFGAERRLSLYGGLFGLSVNMIVTALRVAVLGVGAWLILHGHLTIGGLVAFISLMGEVISPVTVLTGIGQQIQASTGALVRINEVLDATPDVVDNVDGAPLAPLSREIRLKGVGFSYTSERRTLSDIDATIPAGSRVAFVGPTGAGKSSTLQLLMRFYDPDAGSVLFDGRDIRDAPLSSLRGQLGVVFQETFLFGSTVRENIALGRPGATDAEVEEAAKAAELHEFIMTLPRGYDTLVGERGSRLSGGQRQRLSIARALLRDPRVLLLDEATSALDPRTERLIANTLERVSTGRTTIAVTHRLGSITGYDRIFVLVNGEMAEVGTHDQLLAKGGVYADLWAEQTGKPVVAGEAPFDAIGALARIPLFNRLSVAELGTVAGRLEAGDLAVGQSIPEGGGRLILVRRGRATVLGPNLDGTLSPVTELGPGDTFGLAALLGYDRGNMLQAAEPLSLLILGDQAVRAVAVALPSVAEALQGANGGPVAPAGGQRLSRITNLIPAGEMASALARPVAPSASPGQAEVRRLTGSFRNL